MSNAQHTWDLEHFPHKHKPACLNRHVSHFAKGNTCSHRGQAYLKALDDESRYKWPADVTGPKKPGDWDVTAPGNYQRSASKPFRHEAHHLVPNSDLRAAIDDVGAETPLAAELTLLIRGGLLDEGYNLNDKINMVILPMCRKASKALKLPRHRRTPEHRSHRAYSALIKELLDKAFTVLKPTTTQCETKKIAYRKTRSRIENISKTTCPKVLAAGAIALDDVKL
ncbi:MAG: hypothetical protein FJ265_12200 [Planctomycetes bacterium]|nr:hypothetical protein [Planctomycetota bacterium]